MSIASTDGSYTAYNQTEYGECAALTRKQYGPFPSCWSLFIWRVSAEHIYIANEERGYEILDYDLEANLRRKIRKDYRPVAATNEVKRDRLGPGYDESGGEAQPAVFSRFSLSRASANMGSAYSEFQVRSSKLRFWTSDRKPLNSPK